MSDVAPDISRQTILVQIEAELQTYNRFIANQELIVRLENAVAATAFYHRAEALIRLLEVADCGNIGGYDGQDPKCGSHIGLQSRFEWLRNKYKQ